MTTIKRSPFPTMSNADHTSFQKDAIKNPVHDSNSTSTQVPDLHILHVWTQHYSRLQRSFFRLG